MADVRLIDANAVSKTLRNLPCGYAKSFAGQAALKEIENAPTIDAVPVVHGRWEEIIVDRRHQITCDECTVCGFKYGGLGIENFRYCPNCGAKMDGGNID